MKAQDLVGKWKIKREICSARGDPQGRMCGVGYFHLTSKDELLYQEQLWHETENSELLFASKSYRYVFKKKEIWIYFHQEEENRLFMTLPISKEMSGIALCGKDHYRLKWDWMNTDNFLTCYTVKGTKKDYTIESEFRR